MATWLQYVRTFDRACQDGNKTRLSNSLQADRGIGAVEGLGVRMEVEEGVNRFVVEGVRRAFRFVLIESSIVLRETRRKSRSRRVLKQNDGVRCGVEDGVDITRASTVGCIGRSVRSEIRESDIGARVGDGGARGFVERDR